MHPKRTSGIVWMLLSTDYASWGIALNVQNRSDVDVEKRLRHSDPPVIARLQEGRVLLDFRTVLPNEEQALLRVIQEL
jgi:L-seryl-tRNA(Ser) seleniumtransferase